MRCPSHPFPRSRTPSITASDTAQSDMSEKGQLTEIECLYPYKTEGDSLPDCDCTQAVLQNLTDGWSGAWSLDFC